MSCVGSNRMFGTPNIAFGATAHEILGSQTVPCAIIDCWCKHIEGKKQYSETKCVEIVKLWLLSSIGRSRFGLLGLALWLLVHMHVSGAS